MEWLKGPKMAVVWAALRIWLGYQWFVAGVEKLGGFDATGFLKGAIAKATGEHPAVQGWYAAFLENFALPNVELFNFIIPIGEVLVGIGLILGLFTTPALIAGAFMNLNFMLAGTTSTNPIMYTEAIILMAVGAAAYYWGADRFILPYLRDKFTNKKFNQQANV
ncbi:MAG: DoxX family membrane protein [Bacillaceae bacterium]|jgi:DoxX.|uniref:Crp/Fnr family transcriptional regulator n=2 Tax=Aeribacillus TaxID=1055323 RepID=A0A161WA31_9BACI|nr:MULTISPECIES: DoxX family membrane protein [Aeribacillus]AXI38447.1 DoxX family membrane protein [Bacillaceae bacterium ZC4]REJ13603.1 MAG: DoxX family membrane protein [Bacillaceae bacterium]ASS89250.1 Crp/Fnr family transcriptional regulator [Aeribacillus pallidus]KZM57177.1 Crp/Fnr family transcriptional regulator [Aeribacillus pallidus]MDR9792639.1 DoxX family membrane protein [Aeribacillus pallidus]